MSLLFKTFANSLFLKFVKSFRIYFHCSMNIFIISFVGDRGAIEMDVWPLDHKLRKFISLELYLKYPDFSLTYCFDKLQIWTIWTFENIIWISINYQNCCESYVCLKFWLKNILRLWSWGQIYYMHT